MSIGIALSSLPALYRPTEKGPERRTGRKGEGLTQRKPDGIFGSAYCRHLVLLFYVNEDQHCGSMSKNTGYFADPSYYHYQELFRSDEEALFGYSALIAAKFLDNRTDARVLDLCCGTGLSLERIVAHPAISHVTGVDIDERYIQFASGRFKGFARTVDFKCVDAVEPDLGASRWDLIILSSAYHHIEDERKVAFLKQVATLMCVDGLAIIGENILPDFDAHVTGARSKAIRDFYSAVLKDISSRFVKVPKSVEESIETIIAYGEEGEYEYKVPLVHLLQDLQRSNLKIVEMHRVWPSNYRLLPPSAGNFVICVQRADE